ncbi:uncharacterized protein LOC112279455 [Physcomitrium patens]|uniref:Complex 1 LYR protein n=1 Tax=Physcomitrium patens TaxID=3218 RepID=A0A2K1KTZ1_PHYPA|nr:uncharacterized protein LOC112279455 [Physcomitrium patens]PNR57252.1 hypothetical protein PHYPA_004245 [Physcomitrium patens]|eukprot:XP_024369678.1 uncharacterized protein LOC112279455 [Physcomitrella patens]
MSGPVHHVYRDLLKAVRKHAAADHFSSFVRQSFRDSIASKDADALQKSLALAKDYAYLVRSVHAHKDLLISYNIGVDRETEQSVRLKDTANRVGLSMPKLFEEEQSK